MGELENKVGQCCDMLGRHGHGTHELTPVIATCSRPAQGQETILASILAGNISWPPWLQVKDRQTDKKGGRQTYWRVLGGVREKSLAYNQIHPLHV